MAYLEKRKGWKEPTLSGNDGKQKSSGFFGAKVLLSMAFLAIVGVIGTFVANYWTAGTYFNPYKGVSGIAFAAPPGKPLNFMITRLQKTFGNFVNGLFPLDKEVSIVAIGDGEKIDTDLDPVRFAGYNVARQFFSYPATDWVFPSRLFANGKKMTEAMGSKNWGMAFNVVPYGKFNGIVKKMNGSSFQLREPFFLKNKGMQGLENGFERKFADGKTRLIKPNDNWLFIRPNVHGLLRNKTVDLELGAPSVEPEQALPLAFYTFTNLCDWKTGQWDVEKTQWLISRQYAIAYGIYLDPEKIEIAGKGVRTRFLFNGDLPVEMAVVLRWKQSGKELDDDMSIKYGKEQGLELADIPVPIKNKRNELCFWSSLWPDQSIVIPFSYLHRMEKDDTILLASGTVKTSLQEILDETQQVRDHNNGQTFIVYAENKGGRVPFGTDVSTYVVKTPRLEQVANEIIGDATDNEEVVENIMLFTLEHLPYVSDHKGNKHDPSYKGPIEVPMSPSIALINRGEDCEGHAIFAVSLFLSATHPAMQGKNKFCALATLDYYGIGHVMPLFPNIVGDGLKTHPFPNHILFPIEGSLVPLAYTEPTGLGYNDLHQDHPQKRGYLPGFAMLISGAGKTRKVGTVGFNQFEYLPEEIEVTSVR